MTDKVEVNKPKLSFFFGAGAEVAYGLPSGGEFAIDLFRTDPTEYKQQLREELRRIERDSGYVRWLPDNYESRGIYSFGKSDFSSLIESSIQYRKSKVIKLINDFDSGFTSAAKNVGVCLEDLESCFNKVIGRSIGDITYKEEVVVNDILAQDVSLFDSSYYSACLKLIQEGQSCDDLKRYVTAFLQLLVGAYGQEAVKKLNEQLFTKMPDDLPIFEDIFGMFSLSFERVGYLALDLLLHENREFDIKGELSEKFVAVLQNFLESIFSNILDYQKVIDENYRYLFSPKTEWARFTRMNIFLKIAHNNIKGQSPTSLKDDGYYHDIKKFLEEDLIDVTAVGTSNYNSIFCDVVGDQVDIPTYHLNGSLKDFYNPYKNEILQLTESERSEYTQLLVPFMLTQSGLKPLTTVEMSRRYVDLFDKYLESDEIISVGFGFNIDDSHINGLFRELIENHDKRLTVISIDQNENHQTIANKLRLSKRMSNISVIHVDREKRESADRLWLSILLEDLADKGKN